MALSPYTTNAEVRAALGISIIDMPDETLDLKIYQFAVEEAFYEINSGTQALIDAARAASPPTAKQTRLLTMSELYATYVAAAALVPALPLAALKEMRDDRTADVRVDDPFKNLADEIGAMLGRYLAKLEDALLAVDPTIVISTPADVVPGVAATLGTDPVTG